MKIALLSCLLLAAITLPAWNTLVVAQEKGTAAPTVIQDPYALYRKVGRVWVRRTTIAQNGGQYAVSTMDYEVIEVGAQHAVIRCQALDSRGRKMRNSGPTDTRIDFLASTKIAGTAVQLRVEAGEFPAVVTETKADDLTFKMWYSTKYGGLLLKSETPLAVTEVVQFHADARPPEAERKAVDDPYVLFRKKGRTWTHKSVTKLAGIDDLVSYMKYEITDVADDHAMYKAWILDKDKKPMAGMPEPTPMRIEFREYDQPAPDPRQPVQKAEEETITVEAGKFECLKTDVAGTKTWMSKKYPGLMVKMEGASNTMELIEYKD